ncbi:hypothetical protein SK128_021332, partial [Halocaridina rubra]
MNPAVEHKTKWSESAASCAHPGGETPTNPPSNVSPQKQEMNRTKNTLEGKL